MNRVVYWSPMFLAVALSPAFLQSSCNKTGNPNLVSLELEAGGINRIVGFSNAVLGYNVWLDGATTMTVRGESVDPGSRIGWEMADGSYGEIGFGTGELTFDPALPDDTTLFINVTAPGGKAKQFALNINPPCTGSECDDNNSCTSDACNANVCEFTTEADGTPCTDADGGLDQCLAGICQSNAVTASIPVFCQQSAVLGWVLLNEVFELTIDPLQPVVAGGSFDVETSGVANVSDFSTAFLAAFEALTTRFAIDDGAIAVLPRTGATGSALLEMAPAPTTCAVDANGNRGLGAGPFPACDPANNTGSSFTHFSANTDCVGLGGAPTSNNPCLPFRDLTIIDGTADGCAACQALDVGSGFTFHGDICSMAGVCSVLDDKAFLLAPQSASFSADPGTAETLFGFEESSTYPPPSPQSLDGFGMWWEFESYGAPGPGGVGAPWECFMGQSDGSPAPDSVLISIPVEQP